MFDVSRIFLFFFLLFLINFWSSYRTYAQSLPPQTQNNEPSLNQSPSLEKKQAILSNDKFFHKVDFFMTYTQPTDPDFIPFRHSYFWGELFTGYQFNKNSSLVNTLRVSKVSISNPFALLPRDNLHALQIMFFPAFRFEGSIQEAFLKEGGDNHLSVEFGHLMSYTPSKGLIYSEMTIYGLDVNWDLTLASFDFSVISYGYDGFDDFIAFYAYAPRRYIGVGIAVEFNGVFGRRLLPEVNAEINFTFGNSRLNFFAEVLAPYLYEYILANFTSVDLAIKEPPCGKANIPPHCNPYFNEEVHRIFLGEGGGRSLFSQKFYYIERYDFRAWGV